MTASSYRILCVHQGGELYGSDRSFLQAVQALRDSWQSATIDVVLAGDGPLRQKLSSVADNVAVRDLAVLRLAEPMSTIAKGTFALPYYGAMAAADIHKSDLVYINTTVIADYILAARTSPKKSIIHVREIPKPRAMPVINSLLRFSGANVIFNSQATRDAFRLSRRQQHAVVHNGVDAVARALPHIINQPFTETRPLRLAMLGRISNWKGQDLFIDSLAELSRHEQVCVDVRIIGSTFRDVDEPVRSLQERILRYGLERTVRLEPFQDDPSPIYDWADMCVVPSRLPEPFGRVAIEAMAHSRPVIAAEHGGLIEIIEHNCSGLLFKPNDPASLAAAIRSVLHDPASYNRLTAAARVRFEERFSSEIMNRRLTDAVRTWILST